MLLGTGGTQGRQPAPFLLSSLVAARGEASTTGQREVWGWAARLAGGLGEASRDPRAALQSPQLY